MQRSASLISVALLWVVVLGGLGCSHSKKLAQADRDDVYRDARDAVADPTDTYDFPQDYEAVTASALVFDPPVADVSAQALVRDGREPSAFVGYDSLITTYFYLRIDDRIREGDGRGDRYERRAVSEKFGVSHR
jgi:hypothetical protein